MVTHLFSSFKDFQEFCKEDIRHPPPHTHTNPVCSTGVGVSVMESKAQHLVRTSQEENSIPLAHASLSWTPTGWGQEPPQGLCSRTHHLPWNVSVQIEFRPLAYYLLVSPHPTLRKGFLQPLHQSGRGGSGDKSSHLQTVDDTSKVQEVFSVSLGCILQSRQAWMETTVRP